MNGLKIRITTKNTLARKRRKGKITRRKMFLYGYLYYLYLSILDLVHTYFGYVFVTIARFHFHHVLSISISKRLTIKCVLLGMGRMDMAWQLIFLFYHLNNYWVWRHGAGSKRYRRRSSYRIDILILIIWDRYDLYEFQFSSSTSDQQRQKHGETVGYHQRWSIWRWLLKIHTGCPWLDIEEMTIYIIKLLFSVYRKVLLNVILVQNCISIFTKIHSWTKCQIYLVFALLSK